MKNEKAVILITLLSITLIISVLVMILLQSSLANMHVSQKQLKSIIAIDAAEAGIAATIYNIEDYYTTAPASPTPSPYSTQNNGTLAMSPHKVEYKVTVLNNIAGNMGMNDPTGGYAVPPKSMKLISYGYIDKGKPGEYKRIIEVILRPRSLNLSLAASGIINLGNLNDLYVYSVSGYSGNVHSNYNGDLNNNGEFDTGDVHSIYIDPNVPYYGDWIEPYVYSTGKMSTKGILCDTIKNRIGSYQQNLNYPGLPACTSSQFTTGTQYLFLPKGTYKVSNGKLQRYDYDTGSSLQENDVVHGFIKDRLDLYANFPFGDFGQTMAQQIYDNLDTIITFPDATTMQVDIPSTGCPNVSSINFGFNGNVKIKDSNFKCLDAIDVNIKQSGSEDGDITVTNSNFSGNANIIAEGKIIYEGYSNIKGGSHKPAMYGGKGIDIIMKEGVDPNSGYSSGYIQYRGVIYSGGPIKIRNDSAYALFVEGSLLANDPLNESNGSITFDNNSTDYTSMSFRYNPDYSRDFMNLGNVPGATVNKFDIVFWNVRQ